MRRKKKVAKPRNKKRVIRDWMGEDWTVEHVNADDPRLQAYEAHGLLMNRDKHMVIERQGSNTTVLTVLHEVAHRATQPFLKGDENEELKVDTIALVFKQFLEKMGIDLSKLAE